MKITQQQANQSLQEIDDASFHLRMFAEKSHVPQDLAARITAMADLISILADDMEEHFDDHKDSVVKEDNYNDGFNEIMDADINSMLRALSIRG
tara:strand:- start:1418 stop:1699 length:282 start_codon:yes stop_codon:yes gene_type:complete